MAQRYMSDANDVDIEVPAELIAGVTTVAEAGGRLEKSYVGLVPEPKMEHRALTGSLKITGKSNLGKSMYRYKLSDFWVSSCEGSPLATTRPYGKPDYCMDRGHLPKSQVVEPLALGQVPSLVLLYKLSGAVRTRTIMRVFTNLLEATHFIPCAQLTWCRRIV